MAQCEAILITHGDGYTAQRGDQCTAPAKHVHKGRAVCWVHLQACTTGPRACGMAPPVEFVEHRTSVDRV